MSKPNVLSFVIKQTFFKIIAIGKTDMFEKFANASFDQSSDSTTTALLNRVKINVGKIRGLHSIEVAFLLLTQLPRVQFSAFLKFCFNVTKFSRWHWLEESG